MSGRRQQSLHAQLPLWRDSVPAIPTTQQQSIASALLPVGALPESVWLHGSRVQFDPDTPIKLHKATKAGYLIRKPQLDSLAVGDLVAQRKISKGMNKWRMMSFQGKMVEPRRADRKHPDFAKLPWCHDLSSSARYQTRSPSTILIMALGLDYNVGASLFFAQALPSFSSLHKAGSLGHCCQKSAGDYRA